MTTHCTDLYENWWIFTLQDCARPAWAVCERTQHKTTNCHYACTPSI